MTVGFDELGFAGGWKRLADFLQAEVNDSSRIFSVNRKTHCDQLEILFCAGKPEHLIDPCKERIY